MSNFQHQPGRGLNSREAKRKRIAFLKERGIEIPTLAKSGLSPNDITNNIESFIGAVEIPVGLVGPLVFSDREKTESVFAPIGTLEGALVASMNRGAKAISKSGGFKAVVIHQRMIRSPMFIFKNLEDCVQFKKWVEQHFESIKKKAEEYSNHASLITIDCVIANRSVHLKMVYTTEDAAGQNMTTTCTAHAMAWVHQQITENGNLDLVQYVIEGNASSDKKLSHYSVQQGRGIHVIAECELKDREIERVLRVKSTEMLRALRSSQTMSRLDGMLGYNINVTNALAGIFVATGQDLASIHESGVGILNMEKTPDGLYCSLALPALVIGTLGGGTQLSRQQEALEILKCAGPGKIKRFAKLIAGFALGLEVSTFAAIVGGHFAKVHERMGRNKPADWLVKGEINHLFLSNILKENYRKQFTHFDFLNKELVDNGLIINLTKKINNKITGFIPLLLSLGNDKNAVLLKSKPLDKEVLQGLHYMAATVDPYLADLFIKHQNELEFKNCHLKEIQLYKLLDENHFTVTPQFYGSYENPEREIYVFLIDFLSSDELSHFNTENHPDYWKKEDIKNVIQSINKIHQHFYHSDNNNLSANIPIFEPWKASELYTKFAEILKEEYKDTPFQELAGQLGTYVDELEQLHNLVKIPKTIIHHDFNPRNVAIRKNGKVCIYDWELAVQHFPQRDIVEFLTFVLPLDFDCNLLWYYLKYHYKLESYNCTWKEWIFACNYVLKEYLVTRVSLYLTGKIVMNYLFAERIFLNSFRMIGILKKDLVNVK